MGFQKRDLIQYWTHRQPDLEQLSGAVEQPIVVTTAVANPSSIFVGDDQGHQNALTVCECGRFGIDRGGDTERVSGELEVEVIVVVLHGLSIKVSRGDQDDFTLLQ